MVAPVVLPRIAWGDPSSARRALLVHGLGSTGALMWRFGEALAAAGWYAEAVDLRGHGRAPRALDYSIEAFVSDLLHTRPSEGEWSLVVGHSLGSTTSVVASARDPRWTQRLVLIDPAIYLSEQQRQEVRDSQEESFAASSVEDIRAAHPHWHPQDVELKHLATTEGSRWAIEQTTPQNPSWDVRPEAAEVSVPTLVIAGDPEVYSLFHGDLVDEVLTNDNFSLTVIRGAGHSPQRDKPDETANALLAWLES